MAYERVNGAWPEGTRDGRELKLTPQEAISAVRRLWYFGTKHRWRGKIIATSGNRRGGWRRGVWYINPDRWGGGWHEVVHHVSHMCAYRVHPNLKAHSTQHAFLEKRMIEYVVRSGWLEGKLKREAPEKSRKPSKHDRVVASIKRWEAKRKRAETALKKLRRQQHYYECRLQPGNSATGPAISNHTT